MVARAADACIVVSEHMKAFLPRSVSAHVIPSGLDLDQFRPIPREEARARLGLPLDKRLVLFVGNPAVERKRYPLAREAVDILKRSLPADLMVAWSVRHRDVPLWMNACDALVFTSMQEGSPNAVKEALACDLPVVSVPVGDVAQRIGGVAGCAMTARLEIAGLGYHDVTDDPFVSGFQRAGALPFKHTVAGFARDLDAITGAPSAPRLVTDIDLSAPGRHLLLTFDDGGKSALHIGDVLRARGWRGHFFIVTNLLGGRTFLTAADIRHLRSCGHLI